MERVDEDVDEFLRSAARATELLSLDALIRGALVGEDRVLWRGKMWGGTEQAIVGYGSITQPRPRGGAVEWFLVGLAAQKNHLSIYINAAEDGTYLVQKHADLLGRVKVGSAALTFRSVDDLDQDALRALIVRAQQIERGR